MASAIFRGKAQVSGTSGTVTIASAVFYPVKQSMKLTHNFEEDIVQDENGADCAWRARNEKIDGEIGMMLVDNENSSSTTNAKAQAILQSPYAIITISSCDVSAWNTTWQVVSGSDIGLNNTGTGSMNYRLRRYVDSTQNTLAATTPS